MRRGYLIAGFVVVLGLGGCATPQPPPASHVSPPFDMKYLAAQPAASRSVCVDVDTTVSGGPARAARIRGPIVEQLGARGFTVVQDCRAANVKLKFTVPAKFLAAVTSAGQPQYTEGAMQSAGMAIDQASAIASGGHPLSWALPSLAVAFNTLQKDAAENRRQEPYYAMIVDLSVQVGHREPQITQVRAIVPFRSMANPGDSRELTNLMTREVATTIVRVLTY